MSTVEAQRLGHPSTFAGEHDATANHSACLPGGADVS